MAYAVNWPSKQTPKQQYTKQKKEALFQLGVFSANLDRKMKVVIEQDHEGSYAISDMFKMLLGEPMSGKSSPNTYTYFLKGYSSFADTQKYELERFITEGVSNHFGKMLVDIVLQNAKRLIFVTSGRKQEVVNRVKSFAIDFSITKTEKAIEAHVPYVEMASISKYLKNAI